MKFYKLLFIWTNIIFCIITREMIAEANKQVFIECAELELSVINPFFGHILSSTILRNLRNFYFGIKPHYDSFLKRNYVKDKSTDMLSKFLIKLFPSPGGNIVTLTNGESNLANIYFKSSNDRLFSVKLFANLFLNIINNESTAKLYDIEETESNKSSFNKLLKRIRICKKWINKKAEDDEVKMLSLLTIHSFMLEVLETKDEYLVYITILINNINNTVLSNIRQISISNINIDNNDKITLSQFFQNLYLIRASKFPYDKNNFPASNTLVPMYDKITDQFSNTRKFSDCMEITLLHLFNFLFYNETTEKYDLDHLKLNENSTLRIFYKKYSEPFNITDEVRRDWFKVVQCLDNFECISNEAFGKIKYENAVNRNELSSSITNAINVIVKLCFFNTSNNNITKFYELIKDKVKDAEIVYVFQKILELIITDSQKIYFFSQNTICKNRIFHGILSIQIVSKGYTDLVSTTMNFNFDEKHAYACFIKRDLKNTKLQDIIFSNSTNIKVSPIEYTFITYIKTFSKFNYETYDMTEIDLIYNTNHLITNEQKVEHLYFMFNNEIKNLNTAEMIIKSAVLTDEATRKMFLPFYLKFDDLRKELDCRSKIDIWLYTLRQNGLHNKNCHILKCWNEEIVNLHFADEKCILLNLQDAMMIYALEVLTKTNLKKLNTNLLSYKNTNPYIEIIQLITQCKHLECLEIVNDILVEDIMKKICLLLSMKNNKIESFSAKSCWINSTSVKLLVDILKNKSCNVKTLNLAGNSLTIGDIEILSDLLVNKRNKICSLDISSNFLGLKDLDKIFSSLKHENNNLTFLNISSTFENVEGCGKIIASALEHPNCKLNELNISNNKISAYELDYILTALLHKNCKLQV